MICCIISIYATMNCDVIIKQDPTYILCLCQLSPSLSSESSSFLVNLQVEMIVYKSVYNMKQAQVLCGY